LTVFQRFVELIETDLATAAHRGRVRLRAAGRKVLYGRLKGARVLVENVADLHAKCKKGWTALTYATAIGWYDIARFLTENGAKD
jgi:ankyrin repeat protein